jgi:hypothetical protein
MTNKSFYYFVIVYFYSIQGMNYNPDAEFFRQVNANLNRQYPSGFFVANPVNHNCHCQKFASFKLEFLNNLNARFNEFAEMHGEALQDINAHVAELNRLKNYLRDELSHLNAYRGEVDVWRYSVDQKLTVINAKLASLNHQDERCIY